MLGVYQYLKRHAAAAGGILVALAAADGAYIAWQRSVQAQLIEELTRPGALSGSIILTATETEDTLFMRRDRLRITLASSLFSSDPSQAPLTVDVDVAASFTPFGLEGDVYLLNRTPSTVKLLAALQGIHPKITIRYGFSLLQHRLQLRARAEPFDIRLSQFELGVGPMVWHLIAKEPVILEADLGRKNASTAISASDLRLEVNDPAGYVLGFHVKGADLANQYRSQAHAEALVWSLSTSSGRADRSFFWAGDWRGAFDAELKNVETRARQTADADADAMNGDYGFVADEAHLALHSRRFLQNDLSVTLEDLKGAWAAENVPLELLHPVDDIELQQILRRAGLMNLTLKELAFKSGSQQGSLTANVTSGFQHGTEPVLRANASAHIPDNVASFLDVILRGSRRAFSNMHLTDFMRPETHGDGICWIADVSFDLQKGVVLNGESWPEFFAQPPAPNLPAQPSDAELDVP